MDSFFVETVENSLYRIANVDRHRIFNAEDPGKLAISFDCPEVNPSQEDRAQIFYVIGEIIGAFDYFKDLSGRVSCKLNIWTVFVNKKEDGTAQLTPLTRENRVMLYAKPFSITPTEKELSLPLHLNLPTNAQTWKTGILQRCFRCLLKEGSFLPRICSLLDEQYRRIMRWKLETETNNPNNLVVIINKITKLLGLRHSRDTTPFTAVPDEVNILVEEFAKLCGKPNISLDELLNLWVNSRLVTKDGLFQLEINTDITEVLPHMVPLLIVPNKLFIVDEPL